LTQEVVFEAEAEAEVDTRVEADAKAVADAKAEAESEARNTAMFYHLKEWLSENCNPDTTRFPRESMHEFNNHKILGVVVVELVTTSSCYSLRISAKNLPILREMLEAKDEGDTLDAFDLLPLKQKEEKELEMKKRVREEGRVLQIGKIARHE